MKDILKSAGGCVLGAVWLVAILILADLFLYGSAWISDKVLPVVNLIGEVTFLILIVFFLPLSFFKKCREWCSAAFIYWSYLCGLSLWMLSLLVTLKLWGYLAVIIGLMMMGIGVLPVALLACMFKGEWSMFFQLVVQLAFLLGCRLYGFYLVGKADEEALFVP